VATRRSPGPMRNTGPDDSKRHRVSSTSLLSLETPAPSSSRKSPAGGSDIGIGIAVRGIDTIAIRKRQANNDSGSDSKTNSDASPVLSGTSIPKGFVRPANAFGPSFEGTGSMASGSGSDADHGSSSELFAIGKNSESSGASASQMVRQPLGVSDSRRRPKIPLPSGLAHMQGHDSKVKRDLFVPNPGWIKYNQGDAPSSQHGLLATEQGGASNGPNAPHFAPDGSGWNQPYLNGRSSAQEGTIPQTLDEISTPRNVRSHLTRLESINLLAAALSGLQSSQSINYGMQATDMFAEEPKAGD